MPPHTLFVALLALPLACAFAPLPPVPRLAAAAAPARGRRGTCLTRSPLGLRASPAEDEYRTRLADDFLTQRAVQSLIFLLRTNRDEITANWLGRFAGHEGIELFHGTRGLKVPGNEYVAALFNADTETIIVSLRRRGGRGLSPGNPFAPAEQWFEHTVDVYPRDLGERVLTLRRAIAEELRDDLKAVPAANAELLRSYRDAVRDGVDPRRGAELAGVSLEGYDASIGSGDSTSYRGGNYDLALRLSTHAAILGRLRSLEAGSDARSRANGRFLRSFYDDFGAKFDGDGPNGVAATFVRALLGTEPRVRTEGGEAILIDPGAIAEGLLADQAEIAAHWRDAALADVDASNAAARRAALEASFSTLPEA